MEHDKQGNLSVQMDHMLMRFSPAFDLVSSLDLRGFYAKDVMGNVVYFGNGDFLFRAGEPERGIKSYFSLSQLPPTMTIRERYRSENVDLQPYDELREEWVENIEAESGFNRCNPLTGVCDVLIQHNVPWRYRLAIDEDKGRIFVTEGTKHKVHVMDIEGNYVDELDIQVKFPKRVRAVNGRRYVIDTNNHRVVFLNGEGVSGTGSIKNIVPTN